MDIKTLTKGFDGVMTLSDVHSEFKSLYKAVEYASSRNLFIVFLGDLIDGGMMPYETIDLIYDIVQAGKGISIIGNHDDKIFRYFKGNDVSQTEYIRETVDFVGGHRIKSFSTKLSSIVTNGHHIARVGDIYFTHGGIHWKYWKTNEVCAKVKRCALYGQVLGGKDKYGYPARGYDWVNNVPSGKLVIVGHDMRPFCKTLLNSIGPVCAFGSSGGSVFFTDTGSGKGPNGYISGTVLMENSGKHLFERFVKFKD